MRVDWAILARYVEIHDGLATIIGGGINTYWLPGFPGEVVLSCALRLIGLPDDNEHALVMRVLGSEMDEVQRLEATYRAGRHPSIPPGWEGGVILPVILRFLARHPGAHSLEIETDGNSLTVPFLLYDAPAPPGPAA